MAGRLSRFLNLERRRAATGDAEAPPPVSRGRFLPPQPGSPAPGAAPRDSNAALTGGHATNAPAPLVDDELERRRLERRQELASGIVLADDASEGPPFLRCALCEMDSNRFAPRCLNCGADLSSDEQQRFNDRFWEHKREEDARGEAELRRFHEQQAAASVDPRRSTRSFGEELARTVARRERARLWWMDDRLDPPNAIPVAPGLRLLRLIPSPGWRFAAALGTLSLALFMTLHAARAIRAGTGFGLCEVLLLVILMLFLPRRPRRRSFFGGPFNRY
jgi:hypothetical protein